MYCRSRGYRRAVSKYPELGRIEDITLSFQKISGRLLPDPLEGRLKRVRQTTRSQILDPSLGRTTSNCPVTPLMRMYTVGAFAATAHMNHDADLAVQELRHAPYSVALTMSICAQSLNLCLSCLYVSTSQAAPVLCLSFSLGIVASKKIPDWNTWRCTPILRGPSTLPNQNIMTFLLFCIKMGTKRPNISYVEASHPPCPLTGLNYSFVTAVP